MAKSSNKKAKAARNAEANRPKQSTDSLAASLVKRGLASGYIEDGRHVVTRTRDSRYRARREGKPE